MTARVASIRDHTLLDNIGINTHAQIDSHIADSSIHFLQSAIDHTAILNIGANTHAQIDLHIVDSTIHFTEASIDHLNIQNIGSNSHAAIDSHITDSTIHFTVGSIDHGLLSGLGDDDHTQYALLAGRPASQTLNGGTGVGDTLTLRGSANATLGQINVESPIEFFQVEAESTAPSYNIKIRDNYTTATGVVVQGTIQSSRTLAINTSIWFVSQIADQGRYNQLVTPGFSAFTLFNAFPVISTGGPTAAVSLIGSIGVQSAVIHENDSDGAGMFSLANTGFLYRPGVRAQTGGDTMTQQSAIGIRVFPSLEALNVLSTVEFTEIIGVSIQNPATTGHIGTGIIGTYIGLDMEAIPFGTGTKVALRCALTAATNSFCIQHTGTAQSLFGGDVEIDGDLNHDGNNIGFYGTVPAVQSAAYTRNATIIEDRTLLASASATVTNNNNLLAALIADLQAIGLLG